jgi:hypothetical protein
MSPARVESDSPLRVAGATKRFQAAAEEASLHARGALERDVEHVKRELRRREDRLLHARRELSAARAELAACEGARPPANCSGPARAVIASEAALREAERRRGTAEEVLKTMLGQRDRFESARRRFASASTHHTQGCLRALSHVVASLDTYLSSTGNLALAPTGSSTRGSSGTAQGATTGHGAVAKPPSAVRITVGSKVEGQMVERGWSKDAIEQAVNEGRQVRAVNKATGGPATRYVHPSLDQSVVIDDSSGEVIHVGGPGFRYGAGSGDVQ